MTTSERIRKRYTEIYNTSPRLFRSPGRINLIGEHTDYNNGFVLPAGVDKAVYFAIEKRQDDQVELWAADLGESYRFDLDNLARPPMEWPLFQLSVLDQLKKKGLKTGGFQVVFGGDIPAGAGMSSSAALECCLLFALNELFELGLNRMEIVKMAQAAENEYVGVNCGIMDQFASVFSKQGSVIRLDCQNLDYTYFPFELPGYSLVLCDTTVKHSLASSEYNTRRRECETGVALLKKYAPGIASLRDVQISLLEQHRDELGETVFRRCHYVVSEIRRVEEASELLLKGDAISFGRKMFETHDGLQHDYEVSCDELDFLVRHARSIPGVAGARMMGGGFGGCTLNLVQTEAVDAFEERVKKSYFTTYGRELPCYRVQLDDGTRELD